MWLQLERLASEVEKVQAQVKTFLHASLFCSWLGMSGIRLWNRNLSPVVQSLPFMPRIHNFAMGFKSPGFSNLLYFNFNGMPLKRLLQRQCFWEILQILQNTLRFLWVMFSLRGKKKCVYSSCLCLLLLSLDAYLFLFRAISFQYLSPVSGMEGFHWEFLLSPVSYYHNSFLIMAPHFEASDISVFFFG